MSNFLCIDFINHHGFTFSPIGIQQNTNFPVFEIDDVSRNLVIRPTNTTGMVKYLNPYQKDVCILDYDGFLTSLPAVFNNGKKRCDVILHTTSDTSYFILNELKDRIPKPKVRSDAKKQLLATLQELFNVPTISAYINTYTNKICCYCNSQPVAPPGITAVSAFNRISTIVPDGIQLSAPLIEAFGFIFKQYNGNQIFRLV